MIKKDNNYSHLDQQIANLDRKVAFPPVFVISRKVYGSKPIEAKSDSLPIKIDSLRYKSQANPKDVASFQRSFVFV